MGIDANLCVVHRMQIMTPEQIKNFRNARKLSQSDLASQLGVDQATVSRIERGSAIPGPVEKLLQRLMAEPERAA